MGFLYTPKDVAKELESDPKHGAMWAFVLKYFDNRTFSLTVQGLGIFTLWKASARGVVVDTSASDIATAARWAGDGLREWAYIGIQDTKEENPNIYFARIAQAWATSQKASCTKCLGSTVDFLYLFSVDAAYSNPSGYGMYPINSSAERDLKGILLWVFAGWWEPNLIWPNPSDHTLKIDPTDLHPDYHDSTPGHYDEDQAHHFAFYFYIGVGFTSNRLLLNYALYRTNDADSRFLPLANIVNAGDYYLGLRAAQLGNNFDGRPRFMGAEITYALQNHSPDKPQAVRNSNQKLGHNLWINQDGEVVHSGAPAGNGGPGRFASADSLLSVPERGAPPHPNSPAARTIDPLIVSRYDALRTAPPRFVI